MMKNIEEQLENAPNSSNEKHNVNGHGKLQVHENLKSNAKDKVQSLKKTIFLVGTALLMRKCLTYIR